MHLIYVDESGSSTNKNETYFVLAGVSVYETSAHWVSQELDKVAAKFDAKLELHGSPMRTGKDGWRRFLKADREAALIEALTNGIVKQHRGSVRLFGVVMNKQRIVGSNVVEDCFEQLTSRFDMYLGRIYSKKNDRQRGLMLFDKSSTENRIQELACQFKQSGHSYGKTKNYADVPVFLDSKASRLIQLADLVAYALFRHYELKDSTFFNVIENCFDYDAGIKHGLYEIL
jgi:Protein of unknown function (DUF3800)